MRSPCPSVPSNTMSPAAAGLGRGGPIRAVTQGMLRPEAAASSRNVAPSVERSRSHAVMSSAPTRSAAARSLSRTRA